MDFEKVIHDILFDVVLKAAIARVVSMVPFLGWPVIGPVFGFFAGKLLEVFYDEMKLYVEFKVIDAKTEKQKEEYNQAVENLKVILSEPKEEQNALELEKAKADLKAKLKDLVNFNSPK